MWVPMDGYKKNCYWSVTMGIRKAGHESTWLEPSESPKAARAKLWM